MAAGDVVGQASRADAAPLRKLMGDLWDAILDEVPVVEVFGAPGQLQGLRVRALRCPLVIRFVLERVVHGERAAIRRIRVRREATPAATSLRSTIPTDRLQPGARVHTRARDEEFLGDLYQKIGAFHDDLVRAPRTLRDVRVLLYWTGVMLDAPLCQGDVKDAGRAGVLPGQGVLRYRPAAPRRGPERRCRAADPRGPSADQRRRGRAGSGAAARARSPSAWSRASSAVRPEDDAVIVGGGEDEGEGDVLAGEGCSDGSIDALGRR